MFIAAKIVRVDPAGRLPVIAHLRVLQAIGWRWLCDCTTNRVDVPETAIEFLARASSVANRHRSASGSTLESPKAGAIPFCPPLQEGHTKILSIRSDGASPNSTALIVRGATSSSQGAG
jgi:hypothetical protein